MSKDQSGKIEEGNLQKMAEERYPGKTMKPLKKRDIPDETRPLARMNFVRTLGLLPMAERVMIGLGEQYLKGKDYFCITKHIFFFNKVLVALGSVKDEKVVRTIASDYKSKTIEQIKKYKLPYFIERNAASLISAHHRNFINKHFERENTKL